jgi:hypothetical protein
VRSVGASNAAALRVVSYLFQVCDENVVLSRVRQQDFPNNILQEHCAERSRPPRYLIAQQPGDVGHDASTALQFYK